MCIRFHVKYPSFLSYFNKREFSRQISKKYSNITCTEIPPVVAELFHAHGQTKRLNKAKNHFYKFCERAYNLLYISLRCKVLRKCVNKTPCVTSDTKIKRCSTWSATSPLKICVICATFRRTGVPTFSTACTH
jgi:hypothetical protein